MMKSSEGVGRSEVLVAHVYRKWPIHRVRYVHVRAVISTILSWRRWSQREGLRGGILMERVASPGLALRAWRLVVRGWDLIINDSIGRLKACQILNGGVTQYAAM